MALGNKLQSSTVERKWQEKWEKEKIYSPISASPEHPYYNLMMFPYPSAEGLHVGNMYAFTGADVYGRFIRMQGNDVFEPIGLDGFGIHSENYAIKIGKHPTKLAKTTQARFYAQLHSTGNAYDWSKTLETYDPGYYRWTQWIFTRLFKQGLAYRAEAPVNWCPSCKTVLADEQVIAGKCERCASEVSKKKLAQWFFRLASGQRPDGTAYPESLLANLEKIDWSPKVRIAQTNWIGRSEGMEIRFKIEDSNLTIPVFTTRPDTLHGATFLVLSPDSDWVEEFTNEENQESISEYIKTSHKTRFSKAKSRAKTGIFTGKYVLNPLTGKAIPIWVADYVVAGYGSGAIMGVPAHDERDRDFAVKFKIPIVEMQPDESLWVEIEEKGWGERHINYHLRDWLISRQRYWGPPIPMIYCEHCAQDGKGEQKEMPGWYSVPEDKLPVELPFVENYRPTGTGISPLATDPDFYKTPCPGCGQEAKRETDVSDTFLDSAWYYLRYPSVGTSAAAWDPEVTKTWLPVNMYIGGAEHSVLHLLYSRWLAMVFKDMGLIGFEEPFTRFYAHGLLIKEGAKMSKSKGNIVVPDAYIAKFGADTLRTYLMFLGPFDAGGDFRDTGIEGMRRFIDRIWSLYSQKGKKGTVPEEVKKEIVVKMHQTIKKVSEDIAALRYNTAISAIMEFVNLLREDRAQAASAERDAALRTLILLLAPFTPHLAEEIWVNGLGEKFSVHNAAWPEFDRELVKEEEVTIVVQVNGKLRGQLKLKAGESKTQAEIENMARNDTKISSWIVKDSIKKVVYVPGKLINFVTG
ncbi:leucine--tRNA ligase [Candidatus Woesebacteria bacterium RBG_13_46_13]|uniref:Leucine--tRNA ligase n=1 Tax=Candidatus Woesebacteria bacterium RBG_13_46_13 TaxID=1802479 RepID=A0A1F7X328_9BACT|nr:MAG: leucine--tRNA ligase [Candidatus Woesebacteria bacterium RBG_13_46_13]